MASASIQADRAQLPQRRTVARTAFGLWFMLSLLACDPEPRTESEARTPQVEDAEVTAPSSPQESDDAGASAPSVAQEIYAAGECPTRLLPAGLRVQPTTICAGRAPRQCHEEVPCRSSADCTALPFGHCTGYERLTGDDGYVEFARCEYDGCRADADCKDGEACACKFERLACVAADCRRDSDCPRGESCVRGDECGWGPFGGFICTSGKDECRSNEDCGTRGNSCEIGSAGHLTCTEIICD